MLNTAIQAIRAPPRVLAVVYLNSRTATDVQGTWSFAAVLQREPECLKQGAGASE